MIVDELTIIVCCVLIVLALITPLVNPFFRKPSPDDEKEHGNGFRPKLSVVVIVHDNAKELDEHLPLFLTQDYEQEYEVIVVTDKTDTEAEDVLKRYAGNKRLYTTFTPGTSRYMSKRKLAVTLGVKAAKNEWIVLTDAYCRPASDKWLQVIGENCTPENNLVIGYTAYTKDTGSFCRFKRMMNECYLTRLAQQDTAFRTDGKNVAFRKSEFMAGNGYQGNLKYIYGEYDFLVNKYARKGGTAVVIRPEGRMIEDRPSVKQRRNKQIFYEETRRHLQRNMLPKVQRITDQTALHLNYIAIITGGVFGVMTQRWIVCAAAGVALILTVVLRIVFAKKALRLFGEPIPLWKTIPYETWLVWDSIVYKLRYAATDKYDFICHKI